MVNGVRTKGAEEVRKLSKYCRAAIWIQQWIKIVSDDWVECEVSTWFNITDWVIFIPVLDCWRTFDMAAGFAK